MDNLKIDTGVKRIMVNDDPNNVIEFSPGDVSFAEGFYRLIKDLNVKQLEYQKRAEVIGANKEKDENGVLVNFPEGLAMMRDVCEFMRAGIDGLFGKDTSKKVFGNAMSLTMFEQFFTGITPFIKAARTEKVAKYRKVPHKKQVMS